MPTEQLMVLNESRASAAVLPYQPPGRIAMAAASRPRNMFLLLTAGVLAGVIGAVGLPIAATAMIGLGGLGFAVAVATDAMRPEFARKLYGPLGPPLRPAVRPTELRSVELVHAYSRLLVAHENVRRALQSSEHLVETLHDIYVQCGELVQAAGRAARIGSRLKGYLETNSPEWLAAEAGRLEQRAQAVGDGHAARTFELAAAARRRQLHTYAQIGGLYARVEARIAMLTSFLGAVEALVVKLEASDLEQLQLAGGEMAGDLERLRGDLEILEASLEDVRMSQ